jgi:hypothetical protein
MYIQKLKSNKQKNIFGWHLECHGQKEQDLDPDPQASGTDLRICTNMLRIHTTGSENGGREKGFLQYLNKDI